MKFGATKRDPTQRPREANDSDTWRPPNAYFMAAAKRVDDPFTVERGIRKMLASRRVNPSREFFPFEADEARKLLELIPGATAVSDAQVPPPATSSASSSSGRSRSIGSRKIAGG